MNKKYNLLIISILVFFIFIFSTISAEYTNVNEDYIYFFNNLELSDQQVLEFKSLSKSISSIPLIKATKHTKHKLPEILSTYPESICSGSVCLPPGVTNVQEYFNKIPRKNKDSQSTVENTWGTCPLTGNIHIPVLLVEFTDLPNIIDSSIFNDMLNSPNYLGDNGISVSDYFNHESYGALDITFDVYTWKVAPEPHSYYAQNNYGAFQLALQTIDLFDNQVDFSNYDSDNDGRIDGVVIIHSGVSGHEAGSGNIINQTRIFNGSTSYLADGVLFGNTSIVAEKVWDFRCGDLIYVFNYPIDCRGDVVSHTHEFVHILGGPDLYAINHEGVQVGEGLSEMTMMVLDQEDSNPNEPINLDAWSRYFLGWLPAIEIDSQSAGTYTINSIDTTQDLYYLRDNLKMNDREFFLIENRYRNTNTEDEWLQGDNYNETNEYGGIAIYHIDEDYIEDNYHGTYFNNVMYDEDDDMYDDTISHPGIVFEQRFLVDGYNQYLDSLYTTEIGVSCNPNVFSGKFDNILRTDPDCGVTGDTTSNTYNGLEDTEIVVEALGESGSSIDVYLQSRLLFIANIQSPLGNNYGMHDSIYFSSDFQNPTGSVTCTWYTHYEDTPVTLSTNCSFTSTAYELGIGSGPNDITLVALDSENREATDDVTITINGFSGGMLSPVDGETYLYKESLTFSPIYENHLGEVTCIWSDSEDGIISDDCEFTVIPYYDLGWGAILNTFKTINHNVVGSINPNVNEINSLTIDNSLLQKIFINKSNTIIDSIDGPYPFIDTRVITLDLEDSLGYTDSETITIKISPSVGAPPQPTPL